MFVGPCINRLTTERLFSNPLPGERVAASLRASYRQESRVRGPKSLDSQEFSRLNVL